MKRIGGVKRTIKTLTALAVLIATVIAASCFSGCGERRFLITLKYGTEVLDTILTDANGFADPYAKDYPLAGYEFVGWYKDAELKNEFDKTKDTFWGNGTLYCKRESLEYTVTFLLDGGKFPAPEQSDGVDSVEKPTRPDEKPAPVPQTPVQTADGNYTLTVRSGENLYVTEPVREHYDFAGWRCEGKRVDEDEPFDRASNVIYAAEWQPHKSSITYSAQGATIYTHQDTPVTTTTARQYVDYDSAFKPYYAVKTGYTFNGWWYEGENGYEAELKAADKWQTETNYAVTARFTANEYNVALVTADGSYVHSRVTFDSAYDFSAYAQAPDGYVFDCWEYEMDGKTGTVDAVGVWNVAGQVTLTPRYNANDYKLTLVVGDRIYDSYNVAFGSAVSLPEDPVQSGKKFVGWFVNPDGSGGRLLPGDYWRWSDDQEKTFYARFVDEAAAIPFTVEYYIENPSYTDGVTADIYELKESYTSFGTAGEKIQIDVSGFDDKYEHCGFDSLDELNAATETTLVVGTSATLKFYFKRDTVRYTFMDGDDIIRSREYRIGQTIDLSDVPVKKGYELTGWLTPDGTPIAADAVYVASASDTVLTTVLKLKTYAVSIDGKQVFDVEYGAALTAEMKAALILPDDELSTFDGLNAGGVRISPAELAAMDVWRLDDGEKTTDGKYAVGFTSLWKARKANYTVELWLEGEDGTHARSELYSFEKKAEIGVTVVYETGTNIVAGFTTADGVSYVFDAQNERNVLAVTVTADNTAAVRLYYNRIAA